jgi:hypothetical protein
MNVFAWAFVMLASRATSPSTTDSRTTGSLIQRLYWGMLYPNIFGFDVNVYQLPWRYDVLGRGGGQFHRIWNCDGRLQIGIAVSVACSDLH